MKLTVVRFGFVYKHPEFYLFVCGVYVCIFACVCAHVLLCGGQRLMLGVFVHFPHYVERGRFSPLYPKFTDSAHLSQLALGGGLSLPFVP